MSGSFTCRSHLSKGQPGTLGAPAFRARVYKTSMDEFISEDDLKTFEGFCRYQAIDPSAMDADQLREWKQVFLEGLQRVAAAPKLGLMKLRPVPGEQKYAVAIQDGSDLWLTLWIRCSPRSGVFILYPRTDENWNPHASYHLDGTFHQKSFDKKVVISKRQPLTREFKGAEHLGFYGGHGGKDIGAECDAAAFTRVVKVQPRILGPKHGYVAVDLVAADSDPEPTFYEGKEIISRDTFPWLGPAVVITILK
jgi:hypothetical protein